MSKPDLRAKEAEATQAKEQFMDTLHTLQYRLSPKTIANDVKESVKEKATGVATRGRSVADQGLTNARAEPAPWVLASIPVLVFLFRKPIARALAAMGDRRREKKEARAAEQRAAELTQPATTDTRESDVVAGTITPYEAARLPDPAAPTQLTNVESRAALADQGV